jgi:hypothetical protein
MTQYIPPYNYCVLIKIIHDVSFIKKRKDPTWSNRTANDVVFMYYYLLFEHQFYLINT